MKTILFFLLFAGFAFQVPAQNLISSNPASLQIFLQKTDGSQVMISCDRINNQFDRLHMYGEINFSDLITDDEKIMKLLDSVKTKKISYSTILPEGEYIFQNTVNYKFTSEVELQTDDVVSRFVMDYEISNLKTSIANNFLLTCTGTLSLKDNLGITGSAEVKDRISFQFFQNVRSITY